MEIRFDNNMEAIKAFIESKHLSERENFEDNKNRLKLHYESILVKFSSNVTLQELKLFEIQCAQTITILKGYNDSYEYETELNLLAAEYRSTYISKFEELLGSIIKTIEYRNFKEKAAKSPEYLLPLPTLQKIHNAFDGELWQTIKPNEFYSLFDINNTNKEEFNIKRKGNFNALLWKMYESSRKPFDTKEQYVKPFLELYGGSYKTFGNIKQTKINFTRREDKELMKRISEALS